MDVAQLNNRIAVVNAAVKRLDNERQVNIGKRETLTNQLNQALASYKSTYGVDLTVDNLQSEIERVTAEKTAEVERIESALALIDSGQYKEAESLLGVVHEEPVEQETNLNPDGSVVHKQNVSGVESLLGNTTVTGAEDLLAGQTVIEDTTGSMNAASGVGGVAPTIPSDIPAFSPSNPAPVKTAEPTKPVEVSKKVSGVGDLLGSTEENGVNGFSLPVDAEDDGVLPAAPTAPTAPVAPAMPKMPVNNDAVGAPPAAPPVAPKKPMNFSAIAGGSKFVPQ